MRNHAPSPLVAAVVLTIQILLAGQILVQAIGELNSVDEGYIGYSVFGVILALSILTVASVLWVRGRVRPLVVVDAV